ncbi:MAG: DUF433 domain-containing protein [Gemmatimonadota bacterium]|nr:DUF433 domain-containing protein [Gemmatimonadota bacterium]
MPRRDIAAYPVADAAGYIRVAPATLRSWVVGREYPTSSGVRHFRPLIRPADRTRRLLSFNNLVEAHVLRALRTTHGTPIPAIRKALDYAESELGIERLLLSRELCTDKRDLFLDRYGELINLSRSGQLAMRAVLEMHLSRIERDSSALPLRLYPFVRTEAADASRHIAIDPEVGFGRPIVRRRGISTHVIVDRIDAGESVEALAEDYGLEPSEVEEAVVYERAA